MQLTRSKTEKGIPLDRFETAAGNFNGNTFDLHNTGHVWRNDFEKTSYRNHGGFSKERALVTSRFELGSHNGVPDCHRTPVNRESFIHSSFVVKDSLPTYSILDLCGFSLTQLKYIGGYFWLS